MNQLRTHLEQSALNQATKRLRDAGLLLLQADSRGEIQAQQTKDSWWLSNLFCSSEIFCSALRGAAKTWQAQAQPQTISAFPGCWLSALPRMDRRNRIGYIVIVIVTQEFVASEQLYALCQSAQMDFQLTRDQVIKLPPVGDNDVKRTLTLIKHTIEDQIKLTTSVDAVECVGQQLIDSYEEISLLYTITQSMTVVQHPVQFVTIVCEELLATLRFAWIGAIFEQDKDRLKKLAGSFTLIGDTASPEEVICPLIGQLLKMAHCDTPLVIEPDAKKEHTRFAVLGKTVVAFPICRDNKVIGLLVAGDKLGPDDALSSVDMKLLGATATHMAIFLENAVLYDDLNTMFLGTLEALTASIDAKDRYTRGHSQRVAHLTQQIAAAVGMPPKIIKRMHIAGLVHDVGKIGVPEAVLCKPGKLSDKEFDQIRKHPEIGYKILKDIPQFKDILPCVLYHHERWDGKGYPHGLVGQQIPLIARLMALADAFDAMSSTRTYRNARSRPDALREIQDCAGSQFDPDIAPIFVKLNFDEYDRLVIEHRDEELAISDGSNKAA
ncbi:MAG: HD domain-containing protein [Planctomycetes bacterium]|nr:HD domain-containing protein [Planctomycetota bacterium]